MKLKLLLFSVVFSCTVFSQQKFAKEFSFVNDNDLYVSFNKDQYYTNGTFLSYRFLSKDFKNSLKRITEWTLGQEMYTPYKAIVKDIENHDRPFAAVLFGSYGHLTVSKKKHIFRKRILFGIMGPSALGNELQDVIHSIYNFKKATGWKYQIKNTAALNFDANYVIPLNKETPEFVDIQQINEIRFGTIYNKIATGFSGRIGTTKLVDLLNSARYGTHLNNKSTTFSKQIESFFFWQTKLNYVFYDATMQGSFFNDDSPIVTKPNKLRFDLELGYVFTTKNCVFGYTYHFNSRASRSMRHRINDYGSISLQFLFQ